MDLFGFFKDDKSGKKKKYIYMSVHYPDITNNILEWAKANKIYGLPFDELTYLYVHNMSEPPKDELGFKTFKGWSKGYSALGKFKSIQDKMIVDNLLEFRNSLTSEDFKKQNSGGLISQNIMNNYVLMKEIEELYDSNIDIRHKINLYLDGKDVVPKCQICDMDTIPRKTHGEFRKTCSERCRRKLESDFRNYTVLIEDKKIELQGYERFVIYELISKYGINDIVFGFDNEPIEYNFNGKKYNYYPDFYLKSQNKIIEVKSSYTYKCDYGRNLEKKNASINKGYNFEFNIWDLNKIISYEKNHFRTSVV